MPHHRSLSLKPRLATLLGGGLGIGLAVWLLRSYGIHRIGDLIGRAGWFGILAVVTFHGFQMLCSALGWCVIAKSTPSYGTLRIYLVLRWIREAVNNLLPLAQIGGEVVAWRLLRQRGAKPANAIAGTVADLTLEMVTHVLFTLLGVALLVMSKGNSGVAGSVKGGLLVASMLLAAMFAALRLGLAEFVEKGLIRLGRWVGWPGAAHVEGLNEALMDCYRQPARVIRSALWHMLSWLLGGFEVCLALHLLGVDVSMTAGIVVESLGQAAKALGFAVPGALGVQEGGYIIVCRAFGLPADLALALSLIKRLREVILGIPALIVWQQCETKVRAASSDAMTRIIP
jgi:putative membrane protein